MNTSPLKPRGSRFDDVMDKLLVDAVREKQEVTVDELKRRRIIEGALSRSASETKASEPAVAKSPLFRVAVVAAASVAMLLAIWLLVDPESNPASRSVSPTGTPAIIAEREISGRVDSAASEPSHVHMDFAPGIRAAVTQDTQFAVDRTRLNRITVRVSHGAIWVTKAPATHQTGLEIVTPKGTVLITGTVFSVHVDERSVRVAVLKGKVRVVERAGGPVHTVTAGFSMTVGDERIEKRAISKPVEARAEFIRLGIFEDVDDDVDDDVNVKAGAPVPAVRGKAASRGRRRPMSPEPDEDRVSAKDLLNQIKLLRQQKDWAQMSVTYRRLIRDHRRSVQAGLAMVALGNLLIERLHDPGEAIHWFDTYLKTKGGALAPEALFGKAKALRRLGKRRAELTVLKEIVKRYPESLYAKRAAEWIAEREKR